MKYSFIYYQLTSQANTEGISVVVRKSMPNELTSVGNPIICLLKGSCIYLDVYYY